MFLFDFVSKCLELHTVAQLLALGSNNIDPLLTRVLAVAVCVKKKN